MRTIRPRITEIISGPPHGLLTFAIVSALWTSSSANEAIRSMLNRSYGVNTPRTYFARRLSSLRQVVFFTLMILCIIFLLVVMPIAVTHFTSLTGIAVPIKLRVFINRYFLMIGAVAMFVTVASYYYFLPSLKQTWRAVAPGALLVVVLWTMGAKIISLYVTKLTQLTVVYGSLSGFIATLIFFYIMILIMIYGAEFNHELTLFRETKAKHRLRNTASAA